MQESKAIARVLASGYMLDAKAFEMINGLPAGADVEVLVERLLESKAGSFGEAKVITEWDVAKLISKDVPVEQERAPLRD